MNQLNRLAILLLVFLVACSPSGSGAECNEGVCVSIEVKGPVKALEPTLFTITVKTDKDISGLGVSLYKDVNLIINDVEIIPEGGKLGYQDENILSWLIDTKGEVEYTFSGHVTFPEPTVSYGIFHYGLMVSAAHPSINRVTDSVTIYMDSSGNQLEEQEAETMLQTEFPVPTSPPDQTVVPETPMPTVAWPTETPVPSPTSAPAAYPAPGEQGDAEAINEMQPSPTSLAYPNP